MRSETIRDKGPLASSCTAALGGVKPAAPAPFARPVAAPAPAVPTSPPAGPPPATAAPSSPPAPAASSAPTSPTSPAALASALGLEPAHGAEWSAGQSPVAARSGASSPWSSSSPSSARQPAAFDAFATAAPGVLGAGLACMHGCKQGAFGGPGVRCLLACRPATRSRPGPRNACSAPLYCLPCRWPPPGGQLQSLCQAHQRRCRPPRLQPDRQRRRRGGPRLRPREPGRPAPAPLR